MLLQSQLQLLRPAAEDIHWFARQPGRKSCPACAQALPWAALERGTPALPGTSVLLPLSAFRSALFVQRSSVSHLVNGKKRIVAPVINVLRLPWRWQPDAVYIDSLSAICANAE